MSKIKLGTKIRILPDGEHEPYMYAGDIAIICKPPSRWSSPNEAYLRDKNDLYWADFNNCCNSTAAKSGIWCVGTPGKHFEILEENL